VTWGQLRFIIQTGAPGVSLDIIDSSLNERYEAALEATDWMGLKAHATIQTLAAHESAPPETVALTVGSVAVTGVGTAWTNAITGRQFYRPGDTVVYTATYVGPTTLTLDRPYEGNGSDVAGVVYPASPYVMYTSVYTLPGDCRSVVTVLNPITGLPMTPFSKDGLDASVGQRTLVGYPQSYAVTDDTPETNPPVLHEIEFYPPPRDARGFETEYLKAAFGFDGGNTSGSPLPFLSATLLLAGVRADVATYQGAMPQAVKYEAAFERELARLLLLEHSQRRPKTALKMASRFSRHRLARAARGMVSNWRGGQPGGPG